MLILVKSVVKMVMVQTTLERGTSLSRTKYTFGRIIKYKQITK